MKTTVCKTKVISIMAILLLLIFTISLSASIVGATTHKANSKGKSFKSSWSHTPINTSNRTFKYGYDTTLINEDFTHTYHRTKKHTAYVKNTARAQSKTKSKGTYAKVEIRHASGTVYYSFSY